ncbi:MAG: ParB/Srx family N-terminal domain-containing protein [Acidaminococcaceae bacterium]
MDVAKAIPNQRNPNKHPDKQIKLLPKVIQARGWRVPITVSKHSGFIVRDYGRLQAALLLDCEVVPVDLQDYASEDDELADMIADNRLAELSEIDQDILAGLVAELDGVIDTSLLGYSDKAISERLADFGRDQVQEDDFYLDKTLAEIKEQVTKPIHKTQGIPPVKYYGCLDSKTVTVRFA